MSWANLIFSAVKNIRGQSKHLWLCPLPAYSYAQYSLVYTNHGSTNVASEIAF